MLCALLAATILDCFRPTLLHTSMLFKLLFGFEEMRLFLLTISALFLANRDVVRCCFAAALLFCTFTFHF